VNNRKKASASGNEFFVGLVIVALLMFIAWYFLLRPSDIEVNTIEYPDATIIVPGDDSLEKALQKIELTPVPGDTPTPTPRPTYAPVSVDIIYVVQEGDILSSIADSYGVSLNEIMTANNLDDPDVLSIGQVIRIPNSGQP
jgi:LysM repeat protein